MSEVLLSFIGFGKKNVFLHIFHKNELFWIKLIFLKIKNINDYEKRGQPFVMQGFLKLCTKFQDKRASRSYWRSGNMTT